MYITCHSLCFGKGHKLLLRSRLMLNLYTILQFYVQLILELYCASIIGDMRSYMYLWLFRVIQELSEADKGRNKREIVKLCLQT